jgi:hypothetical protein
MLIWFLSKTASTTTPHVGETDYKQLPDILPRDTCWISGKLTVRPRADLAWRRRMCRPCRGGRATSRRHLGLGCYGRARREIATTSSFWSSRCSQPTLSLLAGAAVHFLHEISTCSTGSRGRWVHAVRRGRTLRGRRRRSRSNTLSTGTTAAELATFRVILSSR